MVVSAMSAFVWSGISKYKYLFLVTHRRFTLFTGSGREKIQIEQSIVSIFYPTAGALDL
jgi:hypothetical protein